MRVSFLIVLLIFVSSCNDESHELIDPFEEEKVQLPGPDPVETTWEDIINGEHEDQSLLIFEAVIGSTEEPVVDAEQSKIRITERRYQAAGKYVSLFLKNGDGSNQYPDQQKSTYDNFTVIADDGSKLAFGDRVKIKALLLRNGRHDYQMDIRTIELVSHFDASEFENAVELTDAIGNDTTMTKVYAYMEGEFMLPMMSWSDQDESKEQYLSFRHKNNTLKRTGTFQFMIGDGPNGVQRYTQATKYKDMVYRDYLGKKIPVGTKVRIYGGWDGRWFDVEEVVVL